MTMAELLTYELDGGIATITMDDGKANAFSIAMLNELHGAFDQAEKDEAILVITGREKFFSGGFDLKVFTDHPEQINEMLTLGATLCERALAFPRPVITAASGHALAAGTFLPLCADRRIGIEGPFKVGLNEVKIGMTVPLFAVELARQRLTPAHFSRAVITAETYDPAGAAEAGFFDQVVAPEDLAETTAAVAQEFLGLNAEAHVVTKLRVRGGAIKAVRSGIEIELVPATPGG